MFDTLCPRRLSLVERGDRKGSAVRLTGGLSETASARQAVFRVDVDHDSGPQGPAVRRSFITTAVHIDRSYITDQTTDHTVGFMQSMFHILPNFTIHHDL